MGSLLDMLLGRLPKNQPAKIMILAIGKFDFSVQNEHIETKQYSYNDLMRERPIPEIDAILIGIDFGKINDLSELRFILWRNLFSKIPKGIPIALEYKDELYTPAEIIEMMGLHRLPANPWKVGNKHEEIVEWVLQMSAVRARQIGRKEDKEEKTKIEEK